MQPKQSRPHLPKTGHWQIVQPKQSELDELEKQLGVLQQRSKRLERDNTLIKQQLSHEQRMRASSGGEDSSVCAISFDGSRVAGGDTATSIPALWEVAA